MSRHERSRGQALAEFAIVIPVFLMMLLGVVDLGRAVWATTSLDSAAREAARFAIVHGGTGSDSCPVGPTGPSSVATTASPSCPYPAPSVQSIVDTALNYAAAGGENLTVSVCYKPSISSPGCTGDNSRGMVVVVTVTSQVHLVTPALLGLGAFSLSGSSSMVVNH